VRVYDKWAVSYLMWTCTLSAVTSPAVSEDSLWTDATALSSTRLVSATRSLCCSDDTLLNTKYTRHIICHFEDDFTGQMTRPTVSHNSRMLVSQPQVCLPLEWNTIWGDCWSAACTSFPNVQTVIMTMNEERDSAAACIVHYSEWLVVPCYAPAP